MKRLKISDDLSLPLDYMTLATVVYGARGSGKTTFGAVVAEEIHAAGQRFCAIDLKGDWWGLRSSADGRAPGIPVVIFGGDHADIPLEDGAGGFLGALVAEMEQSVVLDFEHMSKGRQLQFLAEFFATLYHKNRTPLLIIADEAQRYAPQKPPPNGLVCLGAVEDIVKLGRKHGLGVLLLTQRGAGLNKEVSEICDALVAFRTPGGLDQSRIHDWLEANGGWSELLEQDGGISGWPKGFGLFVSNHPDLKEFRRVQMRQRWTYDSSDTPKVGQRRKDPKLLAQPQLDAIRAQMNEAIQRADAEDPRKLKAKVAELEKALAASSRKPVVAAVERVVEKQVWRAEDLKRLEQAAKRIDEALRAVPDVVPLLSLLNAALAAMRAPTPVNGTAERGERLIALAQAVRDAGGVTPVRLGEPRDAPDSAGLGRCAREILRALCSNPSAPRRTRVQAATLSGYSPRSSGFQNALSSLHAGGYIVKVGDTIEATEKGIAIAPPHSVPLTPAETLRLWTQRLGGKRAAMLEALTRWPEGVTRDGLAGLVKLSVTSSGFANYLSSLHANGLVLKQGGMIRAADVFLGGT